ncbi:hypothetical protein TB2_021263 [Malus domestica]
MARSGLDLDAPNGAFSSAQISEHKESTGPSYINDDDGDAGGVQVTCFSEVVNETTFHLQIIRLLKQRRGDEAMDRGKAMERGLVVWNPLFIISPSMILTGWFMSFSVLIILIINITTKLCLILTTYLIFICVSVLVSDFHRLKSKRGDASKEVAKDPNKLKRPASALFVVIYIKFEAKVVCFFSFCCCSAAFGLGNELFFPKYLFF